MSRLGYRGSLKGIDDRHALHLSAVRHVFGIKLRAAECAGGGDDRAVPIRKTMRHLDLQRSSEDLHGDWMHAKPRPSHDQPGRDVVRQSVGARRPCRLHVKFLEHLHRQRAVIAVEQFNRPFALFALGRVTADRIKQDIGV
jgi:hypothetical protein